MNQQQADAAPRFGGTAVVWVAVGIVVWAVLLAGSFLASDAMLGGHLLARNASVVPYMPDSGQNGADHQSYGGPLPAEPAPVSAPNPDMSSAAPAPGGSAPTGARPGTNGAYGNPALGPNPMGYSNADKAYCKWEGRLRFVGASAHYRAAICVIAGQATYLGLDKQTGLTTRLPAVLGVDSAAASHDGYTYKLNADAYLIEKDGKAVAQEKMLSWWGAGHPELARPGDLGVSRPISYPACDGTGVLVLATFYDPATDAAGVQAALNSNPGSDYLRTDLSCDSFRSPSTENSNGNYVYAVFRTLKGDKAAMCRAMGELNASGDWMENHVDPVDKITCP